MNVDRTVNNYHLVAFSVQDYFCLSRTTLVVIHSTTSSLSWNNTCGQQTTTKSLTLTPEEASLGFGEETTSGQLNPVVFWVQLIKVIEVITEVIRFVVVLHFRQRAQAARRAARRVRLASETRDKNFATRPGGSRTFDATFRLDIPLSTRECPGETG